MQISYWLIERIRIHEGFRAKPYRDSVGKLTIGYGRNLDDTGITREEAEHLLMHDIWNAATQLDEELGEKIEHLNQTRKDVLIEMAFNMGIGNLLKFKKMIQAVSESNYEQAAIEMLDSKWAKQVGERATSLAKVMRIGKV